MNYKLKIVSFDYLNPWKEMSPSQSVLIITGCSAKKTKSDSQEKVPADELYCGDLFLKVKELAELKGYDRVIISAKYGLVLPDEKIAPYDQRIKNYIDIQRLRVLTNSKLQKILSQYTQVLVIMGARYVEVIKPLIDDRFQILFDPRGMGGYLQQVTELVMVARTRTRQIPLSQFLKPTNE